MFPVGWLATGGHFGAPTAQNAARFSIHGALVSRGGAAGRRNKHSSNRGAYTGLKIRNPLGLQGGRSGLVVDKRRPTKIKKKRAGGGPIFKPGSGTSRQGRRPFQPIILLVLHRGSSNPGPGGRGPLLPTEGFRKGASFYKKISAFGPEPSRGNSFRENGGGAVARFRAGAFGYLHGFFQAKKQRGPRGPATTEIPRGQLWGGQMAAKRPFR